MSSREGYRISGNTLEELKLNINFFLQSIANRLDKIEGIRGTSTVESNLDLSGNNLVNVGNFDQNLGTEDNPQFGGLTIDGDLSVTGLIKIEDVNGTVIHQLSDT